jgi:hypothetical protein
MEAIPILLFIAPSWLVACLYYWLSMRPHLSSEKMALLNQNLSKVGLYWSNCYGDFHTLGENSVARDMRRARRNFWLMTGFLSLLSILGMLLLIALFMSGHPRRERNAFASALVSDPSLSPEQVSEAVREIQALI